MKTENITRAKEFVIDTDFNIRTRGEPSHVMPVASVPMYEDNEMREANSELIAEAFNVANETGKSPRELVQKITELRMVLGQAKDCIDPMSITQRAHLKMVFDIVERVLDEPLTKSE